MKTFLLTTAAMVTLAAGSAHAYDVGGALKSAAGSADCAAKAATLAKSAGNAGVKAFEKYSANSSLTAKDLGLAEGAYNDLTAYTKAGCAEKHLKQALSAAAQ